MLYTEGGEWYRPVRRTLGFSNPNALALYVLALLYACFIVFESKLKTLLVIIVTALTAFILSGSRGLLLGVFSLFASYYIFSRCSKRTRNYILFLFPLVAFIDIAFFYQFSFGPIESRVDRLSSFRFSYAWPVLQDTPITLFGSTSIFTENSNPFDNSYAWFLLVYGIAGTMILLMSIFFGLFRNSGNIKILALCSAICIVGLVESKMSDPVMSFPLIKIIFDHLHARFSVE